MLRERFNIVSPEGLKFVCSFEKPNVLVLRVKIPKQKAGEFITGAIRLIEQNGVLTTQEVVSFQGLGIKDKFTLVAGIKSNKLIPEVLKKVNESERLKGKVVLQSKHIKDNTLSIEGYPRVARLETVTKSFVNGGRCQI